ncbi:MAG: M3 family metallopeptidase [Planctomycetaceae bacterium]
MTFREVQTLFHEFGHGLQHMLTRVTVIPTRAASTASSGMPSSYLASSWRTGAITDRR